MRTLLLLLALCLLIVPATGCGWFVDDADADTTNATPVPDGPVTLVPAEPVTKPVPTPTPAKPKAKPVPTPTPAAPVESKPAEPTIARGEACIPSAIKYVVVERMTVINDELGPSRAIWIVIDNGVAYDVPVQHATYWQEDGVRLSEATEHPLPQHWELWDQQRTLPVMAPDAQSERRSRIEVTETMTVYETGQYYFNMPPAK